MPCMTNNEPLTSVHAAQLWSLNSCEYYKVTLLCRNQSGYRILVEGGRVFNFFFYIIFVLFGDRKVFFHFMSQQL